MRRSRSSRIARLRRYAGAVPCLRRSVALGVLTCSAVLAWPAAAGAVVDLTAVGTRVADHPAYVRVVVDFTDGTLRHDEVRTVDPRPFDGTARLRVDHPRVQAQAPRTAALGVRVRVVEGTNRIAVRIRAARRRFKYVSYAVVGGDRLAIDLWKSRPPGAAAEVRVGPSRCLTLRRVVRGPRIVRGFGRERNLFEHTVVSVLRGRGGGVLARKPTIATRGRWSARLGYRVARRQAGTFEAFARSARDGSLDCLVQRRVVLPVPTRPSRLGDGAPGAPITSAVRARARG